MNVLKKYKALLIGTLMVAAIAVGVSASGLGNRLLGQILPASCNIDADCNVGETCVGADPTNGIPGFCEAPAVTACSTDADCNAKAGETCVIGKGGTGTCEVAGGSTKDVETTVTVEKEITGDIRIDEKIDAGKDVSGNKTTMVGEILGSPTGFDSTGQIVAKDGNFTCKLAQATIGGLPPKPGEISSYSDGTYSGCQINLDVIAQRNIIIGAQNSLVPAAYAAIGLDSGPIKVGDVITIYLEDFDGLNPTDIWYNEYNKLGGPDEKDASGSVGRVVKILNPEDRIDVGGGTPPPVGVDCSVEEQALNDKYLSKGVDVTATIEVNPADVGFGTRVKFTDSLGNEKLLTHVTDEDLSKTDQDQTGTELCKALAKGAEKYIKDATDFASAPPFNTVFFNTAGSFSHDLYFKNLYLKAVTKGANHRSPTINASEFTLDDTFRGYANAGDITPLFTIEPSDMSLTTFGDSNNMSDQLVYAIVKETLQYEKADHILVSSTVNSGELSVEARKGGVAVAKINFKNVATLESDFLSEDVIVATFNALITKGNSNIFEWSNTNVGGIQLTPAGGTGSLVFSAGMVGPMPENTLGEKPGRGLFQAWLDSCNNTGDCDDSGVVNNGNGGVEVRTGANDTEGVAFDGILVNNDSEGNGDGTLTNAATEGIIRHHREECNDAVPPAQCGGTEVREDANNPGNVMVDPDEDPDTAAYFPIGGVTNSDESDNIAEGLVRGALNAHNKRCRAGDCNDTNVRTFPGGDVTVDNDDDPNNSGVNIDGSYANADEDGYGVSARAVEGLLDAQRRSCDADGDCDDTLLAPGTQPNTGTITSGNNAGNGDITIDDSLITGLADGGFGITVNGLSAIVRATLYTCDENGICENANVTVDPVDSRVVYSVASIAGNLSFGPNIIRMNDDGITPDGKTIVPTSNVLTGFTKAWLKKQQICKDGSAGGDCSGAAGARDAQIFTPGPGGEYRFGPKANSDDGVTVPESIAGDADAGYESGNTWTKPAAEAAAGVASRDCDDSTAPPVTATPTWFPGMLTWEENGAFIRSILTLRAAPGEEIRPGTINWESIDAQINAGNPSDDYDTNIMHDVICASGNNAADYGLVTVSQDPVSKDTTVSFYTDVTSLQASVEMIFTDGQTTNSFNDGEMQAWLNAGLYAPATNQVFTLDFHGTTNVESVDLKDANGVNLLNIVFPVSLTQFEDADILAGILQNWNLGTTGVQVVITDTGATVTNANGTIETVTFIIDATPADKIADIINIVINNGPTAVADAATTNEDSAVTVNVLANDTDPEGDALSITTVTQPSNGVVAINTAGNAVTYTPAENFNGIDYFTYTVTDGVNVDSVLVTMTVTAINDAPVAVDDITSTNEDSAVTVEVLGNDTDVDGDTLTVSAVTQGTNGSVAILLGGVTYTPNTNFNGTDNFTYTVSDGNGGTDTGTVTVTVSNLNDNPDVMDDVVVTAEDTLAIIDVLANDSDIDGDILSVSFVSVPNNGIATIVSNKVNYAPVANYNGTDTFTYTASDGQGGSANAMVTVVITAVNDAPDAGDDFATTVEITPVIINVLTNDSDIDGNTLTVISVTQPANGTVVKNADNTLTFTANIGFIGTTTFTYTISDGNGGTATATVSVDVTASTGGGDNEKVTICHIPPGNDDEAHTIKVSANAVDAHLAHGDKLGACSDDDDKRDEHEKKKDKGKVIVCETKKDGKHEEKEVDGKALEKLLKKGGATVGSCEKKEKNERHDD